jgi:hypothetical protein
MLLLRPHLFLLACLAGAPLAACATDVDLDRDPAVAPDGPALSEVGAIAPAPAPPTALPGGEFSTQSQCGPTWDAQPVEQYNGAAGIPTYFVAYHESRVGYHVDLGCSGTLISDDLFLSAGHCDYAVGHTVRFDYQIAPNGTARATRDFNVTAVLEQEDNGTWDYAIVRLANSPGREYGHASIAAVDPPAGSRVTIIGHPAGRAKEIHAGPVFDFPGGTWFRHQIDTVGGNSGSGVLNDHGQLVGIHTDAGCGVTTPIGGNRALRMSQLIPHSPTLTALTRGKVLWRYGSTPFVSLWTVDAAGALLSHAGFNPGGAWSPLTYSNNRLVWRNSDGRISYWTLNDANVHLTYAESGPIAGWTAVSAANDRILWHNSSTNSISLWTVNSFGNYVGHVEHSISAGWTPVNYANNHILWRHTDGLTSLWRVDDAGNYVSAIDYNPGAGWAPLSYENGQLLWRHIDGRISVWNLTRDNTLLNYTVNGPVAGWTALAMSDRRLAWRESSGAYSIWNVNGYTNFLSDYLHSVGLDWTPVSIAGARP